MIPFTEEHRAAIEQVRDQICELYRDLKAYREKPDPAAKPSLEARFDALVNQKTNYPGSIGAVLKEMRARREDRCRARQRPAGPLHSQGRRADIRGAGKVHRVHSASSL